ncbi:MAG: endolytic transglycosylase MltG [Firmicutes bacterium]|nr:endolytic transglycosylase MltG [Bacillota bacterium]
MAKQRKNKVRWQAVVLLIAIGLVALYAGARVVYGRLGAPVTVAQDTTVTVPAGSSTVEIADQLAEAGLIRDARFFRSYAKDSGIDSQLKAGVYQFEAGQWSVKEIGELMTSGGNVETDVSITVPEGLKVSQIARIFADAGVADYDAFLDYCENGAFPYDYLPQPGAVPEPGNRLEGFLFPDTYKIDPAWTEQQIVDMLLSQFDKTWEENQFQARAEEMGKSVYDIVIMASLVEKEAVIESDRALIAGVFYNRLARGMSLQSCATIQFLYDEPKPQLLNSDLTVESPYNTYKYSGLPPAPIASPGLASLQAALYPEDSEYLYFRARTDGSHRFSVTLEEHNNKQPGDQ